MSGAPQPGPFVRKTRLSLCAVGLLTALSAGVCSSAGAMEPWRLDTRLGNPDWLSISGSYRSRIEGMDNTFRVLDPGSDQIHVTRLLLRADVTAGRFYSTFELQDSRAFLDDELTPVGTDDVNAAELLQAHVGWRTTGLRGDGSLLDLKLGRMTLDVGSRRFVARNRFRNTLNAFNGVHARWSSDAGPDVQAFYTLPVARRPNVTQLDDVRDNEIHLDSESLDVRFWGIDVAGLGLPGNVTGEIYLLGIDEDDQPKVPSRNRDFVTAGVRLQRSWARWSVELESAVQHGESRATLLSTEDLDHRAWFAHVHATRQLDARWSPAVTLRYDYASGDDDPLDGNRERFDTLFGARRFEFGPTSIYGALARGNISSPGAALTLRPGNHTNLMLSYRAAWLASQKDALITSGVIDPSGNSGDFVGHQLEFRFRWDLAPQNLRFETGGAYLVKGEFLQDAAFAPEDDNTVYGYAQVAFTF